MTEVKFRSKLFHCLQRAHLVGEKKKKKMKTMTKEEEEKEVYYLLFIILKEPVKLIKMWRLVHLPGKEAGKAQSEDKVITLPSFQTLKL